MDKFIEISVYILIGAFCVAMSLRIFGIGSAQLVSQINECEQHLVRTEECVLIAVPEKEVDNYE